MAVSELSQPRLNRHRPRGHLSRAWSRLIRKKIAVICMVTLAVLYLGGILANWISPHNYDEIDYTALRASPSIVTDKGLSGIWTESHLVGTDRGGRDVFTRVLWGIQNTVILTVVSMFTGGLVIGITLGLVAGYFGNKIDATIMRVGELFASFPDILLVIVLAVTLRERIRSWVFWIEDNSLYYLSQVGPIMYVFVSAAVLAFSWYVIGSKKKMLPLLVILGIILLLAFPLFEWFQSLAEQQRKLDGLRESGAVDYLVVALALVSFGWVGMARLVRGQILYLKETQYVEAAKAIGASTPRILFIHLLPNAISPIVITITMGMGTMVGTEFILSWLGIGIQPPRPSLGLMLFEGGHVSVLRNTPWLLLAPGAAAFLLMLSWNLLGDALNDVLNPRTR